MKGTCVHCHQFTASTAIKESLTCESEDGEESVLSRLQKSNPRVGDRSKGDVCDRRQLLIDYVNQVLVSPHSSCSTLCSLFFSHSLLPHLVQSQDPMSPLQAEQRQPEERRWTSLHSRLLQHLRQGSSHEAGCGSDAETGGV